MTKTVEEIEKAVSQLNEVELKKFRVWYEKFDSKVWDEQIEKDISEGKLDNLADKAISDHRGGSSRKLWITMQAHHFGRRMTRFQTVCNSLPTAISKFSKKTPTTHRYILKKIGRYRSVRVGIRYRALAVEIKDGLLWFWIGSHSEYDKIVNT